MAKTFEPIATTTLGSTSNTITFSNIPQTYTDIYLLLTGKTTADTTVGLRMTQYTTPYYYYAWAGANNAGNVIRGTQQMVDRAYLGQSGTDWFTMSAWLLNYSWSGSETKNVISQQGSNNSTSLWYTTIQNSNGAGINTIQIWGGAQNFLSGTSATIYGVLKA